MYDLKQSDAYYEIGTPPKHRLSFRPAQIVLAGFACALLWFAQARLLPGNPTIVDVGYAKYQGNQTYHNTVVYLGIPYAEPPLRDLRFRAPLPLNTTRVAVSKGVIDVSHYSDFCVQGTSLRGEAGGAGSEDCLKLDIYAPSGANQNSKLPVLFYIHGGGYIFGSPRNQPFSHWIHQSPNVVIVSIYYRLDSFGFLTHPDFVHDASLGDLNVGFLDQMQGLRWVKHHISAFGGDPNRVTINGESAGGSSVELHLVSDQVEPLFHGAIAQSVYRAPVPHPGQQIVVYSHYDETQNTEPLQDLYNYFTDQAGCTAGSTSYQMACLRNASIGTLARAQDSSLYTFKGPYNTFRPVLDGRIIKDYPTRLISEGKFAHVPLIVGATSNETLAYGNDISYALQKYWPAFTVEDVYELAKLYPTKDFGSSLQRRLDLTGDATVRCAGTIMADAYSSTTKAWLYRYNQPNPTWGSPLVAHAAENWMMFLGANSGPNGTTTFTPLTEIETAFSQELIAYWLSFVRAGDPNNFRLPGSPSWDEYETGNPKRIILAQRSEEAESGSAIERVPDIEGTRCRLIATMVGDEQA